jgi:hypothetical protein
MKLKERLARSDIGISIYVKETEENRDCVCSSHYTGRGSGIVLTVRYNRYRCAHQSISLVISFIVWQKRLREHNVLITYAYVMYVYQYNRTNRMHYLISVYYDQ